MHGILKLRKMIQEDPDMGWRERYGARGTEEVVAVATSPRTARSTSSAQGDTAVPDATGLELLAEELREADAALGPRHAALPREGPRCIVARAAIRATLAHLRGKGFDALMSVHGVDYYPEEPRLGVHYELLDMGALDRLTVKLRVPLDDPHVPSVTPDWPTADHQEREIYDMFGVRLRRPPRPAPDPHARGLRGPPAAPRLPDRRRARAVHRRRDRREVVRRQMSTDVTRTPSEYRQMEESITMAPLEQPAAPTSSTRSC